MYTIHSKNNCAKISVLSTECLLFILLLTSAWECFLSTNLSWVSLSMGGQFSLKLGLCDRIVYQFFSSSLWQFSLSLCIDQQRAKSAGCCFCSHCMHPEVSHIFFSLLLCVCTCCLTCDERETSFIKFNPSLGWKYTINRPTALCLKIKWLKR